LLVPKTHCTRSWQRVRLRRRVISLVGERETQRCIRLRSLNEALDDLKAEIIRWSYWGGRLGHDCRRNVRSTHLLDARARYGPQSVAARWRLIISRALIIRWLGSVIWAAFSFYSILFYFLNFQTNFITKFTLDILIYYFIQPKIRQIKFNYRICFNIDKNFSFLFLFGSSKICSNFKIGFDGEYYLWNKKQPVIKARRFLIRKIPPPLAKNLKIEHIFCETGKQYSNKLDKLDPDCLNKL